MRRTLSLTCAALWLACSTAHAAPSYGYGFGSRASALGGAVAAGPGDAAALFYNPAALALAPGSELMVGYQGVSSTFEIERVDQNVPGRSTLETAALGRGQIFGLPAAFGLGLALSNGRLSHVESVTAEEARWVLREAPPELFDLEAAIALQPLSWLALGVGAGLLASTSGGFEVTGTSVAADGHGAEYDSQLRHAVDAELVSSRFLLAGASVLLPRGWVPGDRAIDWSLAVSFRDEAKLEQRLRGTFSGDVDAGFFSVPVVYDFESRGLLAFRPRQLVLGVGAARGPWRTGLDLEWQQWSRHPDPVSRTGTNVSAEVPAGLPLALPPSQDLPPEELAGFEDRFGVRVGVERSVELSTSIELQLRAGYVFLPTPAPRDGQRSALLDADEHDFSLGGGVRWQRVDLAAHALYSHLPNFKQRRNESAYDARGHAIAAGLTLTLVASAAR